MSHDDDDHQDDNVLDQKKNRQDAKGEDGFTQLHEPSVCDRRPARMSKGHFTGHLMIGLYPGRVLYTESWLELNWAYCLDADPMTKVLHEQKAFIWRDSNGRKRTHFFDFWRERKDGRLEALTVKPEARVSRRFLTEISEIARQAIDTGFVDDVRLLTDADLDPVELSNAKLSYAMRVPDVEADAAAAKITREMQGVLSLSELVARIGLGAPGYRALIRCLRSGVLCMTRHERISYVSEVFKSGASA